MLGDPVTRKRQSDADLEAQVKQLLVETGLYVERARVRRRWVRSPITDAIVNSGPGWVPGVTPYTDIVRRGRHERQRVARQVRVVSLVPEER